MTPYRYTRKCWNKSCKNIVGGHYPSHVPKFCSRKCQMESHFPTKYNIKRVDPFTDEDLAYHLGKLKDQMAKEKNQRMGRGPDIVPAPCNNPVLKADADESLRRIREYLDNYVAPARKRA